jgi:hypothetical protein
MTQSANSIEARSADKTALGERANTQETKKRSRADVIAPWRWPKGFCPNPTGRPKHDRAAEIARQVFEDNPDAVYNAMAKALMKGNAYAFLQLAERAYGKLVEKKELTGANGGPVEFREANDADLGARIAQLERDLGLAGAIDEAGRIGSAQAGTGATAGETKDQELLPK